MICRAVLFEATEFDYKNAIRKLIWKTLCSLRSADLDLIYAV